MFDWSAPTAAESAAYRRGERRGLAIAALALALIAFVQLLGIEKSLLAIVLASLSLRGATQTEATYRWGLIAAIIAVVNLAIVTTLLVVFHSTFLQLLQLLQKL